MKVGVCGTDPEIGLINVVTGYCFVNVAEGLYDPILPLPSIIATRQK